jgi:gluconolactonase
LLLVAAAAGAVTSASPSETVVIDGILGPEGPLMVDGSLYFVGWVSNTLSKWDGRSVKLLNVTPGCAHNGLALSRERTLLIACNDKHGAIIETDLNGKQLRRWDVDSKDRPLDGGINDIVVAENGAAYATLSGSSGDPPTAVMGKILYLAPGAQEWVGVAKDFNYANGIGISPDQKTLYVAETVGNSIKSFTIKPDGTLSDRTNFAMLNLLVKNKVDSWWLGPDSMKIDRKGNMYVAQWSGGKVLKLSPAGKLLHVFEIAAGDGTTNVAFDASEKNLYVTVVKDPRDPDARGCIVRIPNVDP